MLRISLICLFSLFLLLSNAQNSASIFTKEHKILLDVSTIAYAIDPYSSMKTIRMDYQQKFQNNLSYSIGIQVGKFNSYSYTKYFDFFTNLNYTQEKVMVEGFHLYFDYQYYLLESKKSFIKHLYFGPAFDAHYYINSSDLFTSKTQTRTYSHYSTSQFSGGIILGYQMKKFKHLAFDIFLNSQLRILKWNSNSGNFVRPMNGFWLNPNQNLSVSFGIRIGYTF